MAASTGRKNIILVIDISGSMSDYNGNFKFYIILKAIIKQDLML